MRLWKNFAWNISDGHTVLNQDFKEFIQLFNENDVRYLVIGGYAVAIHGHPRYTGHIDIWIEMTPENVEKTIMVLEAFGFGGLGLEENDFLTPNQVIQLGYPPNRIDLLTTPAGIQFENCYATKVEVELDEVVVNFIDLENLKKSKKSAGRYQDLADLENLE